MAKLLKLRRGTTAQHSSFTGAEGECTVDTDKETLVVHDGSTAGGHPVAAEDMANVSSASIASRLGTDSIATTKIAGGALPTDVTVASANIVDGTIVNADVNASAAIAGTKISPDFGSQNIVTTGYVNSNDITITDNNPKINFTDSDHNPDYSIQANSGLLVIHDETNSVDRIRINSDGHIDLMTNVDCASGLDVTGNITVSGTVDGRDVLADGTKLDGIESSATADQTAAEIRTLVESASDSNVFTDADHSKLNGIEASATADQTASDIRGLGFFDTSNDGAGSGLDADLLDGVQGANYAQKSGATCSGDFTFQGGAGAITVSGGSDIRIAGGTWSGEYTSGMKIQPDAGGNSYIQYQGNLNFRDTGGNNEVSIDQSGNLTAQGNVTAYSDARLKTDISTINDALGICGKLRGVSYKWIATDKPSIGVIAQEVEEVLPELVLTNQDVNPVTQEITEVKSVDYGKIVGVLINAINELKAELDEHKKGGK